MSKEVRFFNDLSKLKQNAPSGFALAFQIRLTSPSYLFQTYSKEWNKYYSEKGLLMQDPTVMWGFENKGIIRWSDLVEIDSYGVLTTAAGYGLKFGMTWAGGSETSRSIGSLSRSDREFNDDEMSELAAIIQKIHSATLTLNPLSPNDLEFFTTHGYLVSQNIG